jgi:hypothetical protein
MQPFVIILLIIVIIINKLYDLDSHIKTMDKFGAPKHEKYKFTPTELDEIKPFLTEAQLRCLNEWNNLIGMDIQERVVMYANWPDQL